MISLKESAFNIVKAFFLSFIEIWGKISFFLDRSIAPQIFACPPKIPFWLGAWIWCKRVWRSLWKKHLI